jgi:hypothetical protein
MLLCLPALLAADDDPGEIYTCSYFAHTPAGAVTGKCTTQSIPEQGFISRWKLTLTFDASSEFAAAKIKPDVFSDMVRGQCLEDGAFTTVIPFWGELVMKPDDPDYLHGNQACAPVFQVAPNLVTLVRTNDNPLTLQFLFEVRPVDFNAAQGLPTLDWMVRYLQSFQRLAYSASKGEVKGGQ